MHDCEEFRERITEYIIDREDVAAKAEFQGELLICARCAEFYAEASEVMEALSAIDLTISETQWTGIQHRLQARILNMPSPPQPVAAFSEARQRAALRNEAQARQLPALSDEAQVRQRPASNDRLPARHRKIMIPVWVATAALFLLTLGLSQLSVPVAQQQAPPRSEQAVYVEHSVPLDPVTVDFLEESELLLRNVMKIEPTDVDDLADARKVASEQLAELPQRREAASEVPPVVGVMNTYETILRDLRNVDERSVAEDIGDIQRRIQQNGLIANMKAFQPRVTEVSFGLK
jgi:hypothetical protein